MKMRKLGLIISSLALVMGLAQCAKKPNMPTFNGGYAGVTKEVTFSTGTSGDGSKVTIDNSILEELLHYKWESTDVIHVYGSKEGDFTDGQYCGKLKLVSDPGSEEGVFKGTLNNVPTDESKGKLRFYYFGGNNGAIIDLSTQNGRIDNGDESLNKKIVACAEETVSGSEYDKDLEVLYSIIKFDFHNFGACDLTMKGTKNNSFKINEHGVMVETAGTTTTLKGVTAESGPYYVAVLPTDVEKFNFAGNGKVGSKAPAKPLEANYFYTDNGASYVIEVKDVPSPTAVTTVEGCSEYIYSCGGTVTLTAAQNCEVGIVYSKTADVPEIGLDGCYKIGDEASFPAGTTSFNVDITDVEDGSTYKIRAYAIGENCEVVYAPANESGIKTVAGGNVPKPVPATWVNGASPYTFEVSDDDGSNKKYVKFSRGNLQYVASGSHTVVGGDQMPGTWRFAEHQFDIIGMNGQTTAAENVDRDLFGWGTSGYNSKYPYMTINDNLSYGDGSADISGTNYDWGVYNAISNGGDTPATWRTLTQKEWMWLKDRKDGGGRLLYGEGKVSCTLGVIILPDKWDWSNLPDGLRTPDGEGDLKFTPGYSSWSNEYSYSQWSVMESFGAVFLPVAGYRDGLTPFDFGISGRYWSTTYEGTGYAYYFRFNSGDINVNMDPRCYGFSVRLVRNAE